MEQACKLPSRLWDASPGFESQFPHFTTRAGEIATQAWGLWPGLGGLVDATAPSSSPPVFKTVFRSEVILHAWTPLPCCPFSCAWGVQ